MTLSEAEIERRQLDRDNGLYAGGRLVAFARSSRCPSEDRQWIEEAGHRLKTTTMRLYERRVPSHA